MDLLKRGNVHVYFHRKVWNFVFPSTCKWTNSFSFFLFPFDLPSNSPAQGKGGLAIYLKDNSSFKQSQFTKRLNIWPNRMFSSAWVNVYWLYFPPLSLWLTLLKQQIQMWESVVKVYLKLIVDFEKISKVYKITCKY